MIADLLCVGRESLQEFRFQTGQRAQVRGPALAVEEFDKVRHNSTIWRLEGRFISDLSIRN
jgi:hypothetical protein